MEKDDVQKVPDFQSEKDKLLGECKAIQFPKRESPRTPYEFETAEEFKALITKNVINIEELKEAVRANDSINRKDSIKTEKIKNALLINNLMKTDDNLLDELIKKAEENSKSKLTKITGSSLKFGRCSSPESPRESITEELKTLNGKSIIVEKVDELRVTKGQKKLTEFEGKNFERLACIQATLKKPLPKNGHDLKAIKIDSSDPEDSSREPSPGHPLNNSSDDLENT